MACLLVPCFCQSGCVERSGPAPHFLHPKGAWARGDKLQETPPEPPGVGGQKDPTSHGSGIPLVLGLGSIMQGSLCLCGRWGYYQREAPEAPGTQSSEASKRRLVPATWKNSPFHSESPSPWFPVSCRRKHHASGSRSCKPTVTSKRP